MKKITEKRLLSLAISICMILGSAAAVPFRAAASSVGEKMANVVVFVDFADVTHTEHESSLGQCFMKSGSFTRKLFDGDAEHPLALKQYLYQISYGQLQVENIFPQISGDRVSSFSLSQNAEYYVNADNKNDGDQRIIQELLAKDAIALPENATVDYDGDQVIDNLTIVVSCGREEHEKFYGHKSTYESSGTLGGYRIRNYNVIPEYSVYMLEATGILCHEFLHSVGYPDLYREDSSSAPVGGWDIMSGAGRYLPYPLAYLRGEKTGWFTIPTVLESRQDYALYAASKTTAQTKDQQAVILKTDYSDQEFFVLEYRKKGTDEKKDYDYIIQESGLIIYRVNTRYTRNYRSDGDMIYVFRPGDEYDSKGREKGLNNAFTGALSAESGRTSYGSSDPKSSLTDGAITYSDGTNSGIVISNVGSSSGDQITFDITYTAGSDSEYWITKAELENDPTYEMDSCMDTDGSIYSLQRKSAGGPVELYRYHTSGWEKTGASLTNVNTGFKLGIYKGSLYAGYVDKGTWQFRLVRWNGSGWAEVYRSSDPCDGGGFAMTSAGDGICFCHVSRDNQKLYAYRCTASGVISLGDVAAQGSYIANMSMASERGKIVLAYRDAMKDSRLFVKIYDSSQDTWKQAGALSLQGDGVVRLHNDQIYLLRNGTMQEQVGDLYQYSLTAAEGTWSKVGAGAFAQESVLDRDLCFVNDTPYVVLGNDSSGVRVMYPADGSWKMLGGKVTNEESGGLQIFCQGTDVCVIYYGSTSNKVYIRSHAAAQSGSSSPGVSGGNSGASGETGGNSGNPGVSGETGGSSGDPGETGGDSGSSGETGGSSGNSGETGENSGIPGETGGNSGSSGETGGNTGDSGVSGGSGGGAGPSAVPSTPVNTSGIEYLTVTMVKSSSLRLDWSAVPGAEAYEIYYSTSPDSGFRRLTKVKKTFYNFNKAKCGQSYYFQLRTISRSGKQKIYGDFCPPVSGRTVLYGTSEAYISKATYNSITLKWSKVRDAKKYEIYYATSPDGEYQLLRLQGGNSFTHKKLQTGETYYYQVRPVRDFYKGEFSGIVSAKTDLGALTGLKAVPSGEGRMKVSWKKVPGVSAYVVLRSDSEQGPYEQIGVTDRTTYLDIGLQGSADCYYKVYGISGPFRTNTEGPVYQRTRGLSQ